MKRRMIHHRATETTERETIEKIFTSFLGALVYHRPLAEIRELIVEAGANDSLWDVLSANKPALLDEVERIVKGCAAEPGAIQ